MRNQMKTWTGWVALVSVLFVFSLARGQDPLIELTRARSGQFQSPADSDLAGKLAAVRARAADLDRFLARGGPDVRAGWRVYLAWDILTQQLAAPSPDLQKLNTVLQTLYSDVDGVEKKAYLDFRAALHEYMNAVAVASTPSMAQQYDKQLEAIAASLTDYRQTASAESALAVGRGLGWLADAGQASDLVERFRGELARPNLFAAISARLVQAGAAESVDETIPISDDILGTSIVGTARTTANVRLNLIPNERQAEFEIRLDGTALSNNTGTNRGVVIYSTGSTSIAAAKRISLDATGIHDQAARAACATTTVITGICHRLRLVRNIAWKQAGKQKASAESIANGKAVSRVQKQVDGRVTEMLGEAREKFLKKFRDPLLRKNEFPQRFDFSTTNDQILVTMLQANMFQLAAPSEPPEIGNHFDLALRVHESLAGNFSEATVGGYRLTDERLVEILEEAKREVPEELRIDPSKDPWSITFARTQPVRMEVRDQKLKITIRGREFTRGEQAVAAEMDIWAVYQLERTAQGARLTRDGDVQAEYPRGGFENAAKIAVKTLMRKKFDALFKSELDGQGLQLGGRFDKVGPLKLGHLDATNGWLSLGWTLPPDPASTARN